MIKKKSVLVFLFFSLVTIFNTSIVTGNNSEFLDVKYRNTYVDITYFEELWRTDGHNIYSWYPIVSNAWYDKDKDYMVIKLKNTNYHYCGISKSVRDSFVQAHSLDIFYESYIQGNFDCRDTRIPNYGSRYKPFYGDFFFSVFSIRWYLFLWEWHFWFWHFLKKLLLYPLFFWFIFGAMRWVLFLVYLFIKYLGKQIYIKNKKKYCDFLKKRSQCHSVRFVFWLFFPFIYFYVCKLYIFASIHTVVFILLNFIYPPLLGKWMWFILFIDVFFRILIFYPMLGDEEWCNDI